MLRSIQRTEAEKARSDAKKPRIGPLEERFGRTTDVWKWKRKVRLLGQTRVTSICPGVDNHSTKPMLVSRRLLGDLGMNMGLDIGTVGWKQHLPNWFTKSYVMLGESCLWSHAQGP